LPLRSSIEIDLNPCQHPKHDIGVELRDALTRIILGVKDTRVWGVTGSKEALLIKTFDSAMDGRARRSIHTAFSNPLAAPDAPARESIESRLMVFY